MAKSRVEKNKKLYDELEIDDFELEDISEKKKTEVETDSFELEDITQTKKVEEKKEVKVEEKKQEVVMVKEPKKNEVAVVKPKQKKKVEVVEEEEFVVEQPLSYTDKLSVEEILRARLEKQQQLKDRKKGYKKTPNTPSYTPEMMQKNISQNKGVDVRKEVNLRVKRENGNSTVIFLVFLLILVAAAGAALIYVIW